MIGTKLAHYEITGHLGSGGMGDVYQAVDSNLGRSVAIKFLPEAFAFDSERVSRFKREARVLASLNHPNIAVIHSLEESAGRKFLVMELVSGETLADRIAKGAVPVDEAIGIAAKIAEALEAAHEKGITHRDLKPANIKVTDDGTVKVLDFGLAKVTDSVAASAGASDSPTFTVGATQAGMILGTAAYMSPEQARGKSVDKRADIWAFGVVLYELLTGKQLFTGEDISEILAKVIRDEPNLDTIPAQVRPLLRRCLEKDPKRRQRDIGDVRMELEEARAAQSSLSRTATTAAHESRGAWRSLRTILLAVLLLVIGAAAGIGLWRSAGLGVGGAPGASGAVVRLSVSLPPNIRFANGNFGGRALVISGFARKPDGTEEMRARIYARRLDEYEFRLLPGTEGAQGYSFSPDGQWLAFIATVSDQSTQRRLLKVRVDGRSPPVPMIDWEDTWTQSPAWLEDGDLLIASDSGTKFFRLPSDGGPPKPAVKVDTGSAAAVRYFGNLLPNDRGVFFSAESYGPQGNNQWLLDPKTGKAKRLLENAGYAVYSTTGHIVFTRGDTLMAAPFDLDKLAVSGEVTSLTAGLRMGGVFFNAPFQVSTEGSLFYLPGGHLGTDRRLVVVDAAGNVTPFTSERRAFGDSPIVSRDGRKAAVILPTVKGAFETWVANVDRPGLQRVLALPNANCTDPIWSPDGHRLAYLRTARDKDDGIYIQEADGAGLPQLFLKNESLQARYLPQSWAPDGSGLIVNKTANGKWDMLFVPLGTDGKPGIPRDLRVTSYNEDGGVFSPDGRLVAFESDESGKWEIYVAGYGADGKLGLPVMVSVGGGGYRWTWAGDSRRLFYYSNPNKLMSVTIVMKPALSASAPIVAHDLKKLRVNPNAWDILPDGRLLAIQRGEGEDDITEFNIVLNWFTELRERMAKAVGERGGR